MVEPTHDTRQAPGSDPSSSGVEDASLGQLVAQASQQASQLVHDEVALAKAELTEKAKHAGVGAGLFGAAGVLAWFGLGCLLATAILALALVVDAWLAALIVTLVVFAVAAVVALLGKKQVSQAGGAPQAVESAQADVAAVKEAVRHG